MWLAMVLNLLFLMLKIPFYKPFLLNNIPHVSYITKNLLSISQFTKDNNVLIEFYNDYCLIKDKALKKILLEGALRNVLYQLDLLQSSLHSPSLLYKKYLFLFSYLIVSLNSINVHLIL